MTFSPEVLERMRLSREDAEGELEDCEEHREECRGRMRIDYLNGRSLKCDIAGPEMHTAAYNRDNGAGLAEEIVARLRNDGG